MTKALDRRAYDLSQQYNKDDLVALARNAGWKGDPERYSCITETGDSLSGKRAIAYWFACTLADDERKGQQQEATTTTAEQASTTTTTAAQTERTEATMQTTTDNQQAQHAAGQMAAAIAEIMGKVMTSSVSEDKVRAIVKDAIEAMPARVIEFKQGETMTRIEGHIHPALPDVVAALSTGTHVYICGPAGSGKTTLAEQAAKALGLRFLVQGAAASKYDLVGYTDANSNKVMTAFRDAFTNGGLLLLDEADASHAAALLAMQAALANGFAEFPGESEPTPKHASFYCIVAANTWGAGADMQYIGRSRLDAAFLDRFIFIPIDYDESLERAIAGNVDWACYVQKVRAAARQRGKQVVVSPRASINGAKLLAAGMERSKVAAMTLFNRMTKADADELRAIAGA
jgi:MoxR-like ATPase